MDRRLFTLWQEEGIDQFISPSIPALNELLTGLFIKL